MKERGATPAEDDAHPGWSESGNITEVETRKDGTVAAVTSSNGWTIGWGDKSRAAGVVPKVGDKLTTYGQIGYQCHGIALNGVVLWYLTPEQEDAEHKAWVANMHAERKAEFEATGKEKLDKAYDALLPLFKLRIDRFRNANPAFRWEHEAYEMAVCTCASLLVEWALAQADSEAEQAGRTTKARRNDAALRVIERWETLGYEDRKDLVGEGWVEGLSGNQVGCIVYLAKTYMEASERVVLVNGAMAPITGSPDYSEVRA